MFSTVYCLWANLAFVAKVKKEVKIASLESQYCFLMTEEKSANNKILMKASKKSAQTISLIKASKKLKQMVSKESKKNFEKFELFTKSILVFGTIYFIYNLFMLHKYVT